MDLATGSIVAFAGRAFESGIIDIFTKQFPKEGVSHVGILADFKGETCLYESTSLNKKPDLVQGKSVEGCQCHPWREVLEYDGHVYVYPLAEALTAAESIRLTNFLLAKIGTKYDFAGAVESAFISLPENATKLFCSEYVAMALRDVGHFRCENCSALSPIELLDQLEDQEIVLSPIKVK